MASIDEYRADVRHRFVDTQHDDAFGACMDALAETEAECDRLRLTASRLKDRVNQLTEMLESVR